MNRVRPVTFVNTAGEKLFGMFHEPAQARTDVGIVLLSPGVKSRVAPHRLYNRLAERLVRCGFRVLRFDFAGLGDSEGTIQERLLADLYRTIQLGRYTDDTLKAVEWMRTEGGVDRVVLAGLCGGGISGLVAARHSEHVAGLFSIGLPVILDGATVDKVATMPVKQLRSVRRKYLNKLFDPASWMRVVTLQSDFRLALRSILASRGLRRRATSPALMVTGDNGNPEFAPALMDMLARHRPVLMVFSGADRLYWEYCEKFADHNTPLLARHADLFAVHVIERANHVLTFHEWQEAFFQHCERWLALHFPVGAAQRSKAGQVVSA